MMWSRFLHCFLLLVGVIALTLESGSLAAQNLEDAGRVENAQMTDIQSAEENNPALALSPDQVVTPLTEEELASRLPVLAVYLVAIVVASLIGGYLPERLKLTHTRLQILMSFVGGLMLGVALFHLLLHAILDSGRGEYASIMTTLGLGILMMFLLLRAFHFHQHDLSDHSLAAEHAHTIHCEHHHDAPPDDLISLQPTSALSTSAETASAQTASAQAISGGKNPHAEKEQAVIPESAGREPQLSPANYLLKSRFSWMGIALGLSLHSIMDGVALTASCLRQNPEATGSTYWGMATFLAVLLHKPLDAISITTVMSASGWSKSACTGVNIIFAITCPLGAMLAWWGIVGMHSHASVISHLLAFSAGIFLCISLSDLLPEMQFHAHNQGALTASLLSGLALAWSLMMLDPIH